MNPKKVRQVWSIEFAAFEGNIDTFALYNHAGIFVMSDKSRAKLADHAFDHGADEVKHDYDLLKHP